MSIAAVTSFVWDPTRPRTLKIAWRIVRARNLMAVTELVPGADKYEYGIAHVRSPNKPHRVGMTKSEAEGWIVDWRIEGGKDVYRVIRRRLGPWELLGERDEREATETLMALGGSEDATNE